MVTKLHDAVVKVSYVVKNVTKGGLPRFLIDAEKTTGDSLGERLVSFSTLSQWKWTLCHEAKEKGLLLHVKYRETAWFDCDLLFVEVAKDTEATA